MDEIVGNFGVVYITDCIPELRNYQDKYFDLILTDPPYGYNFDPLNQKRKAEEVSGKHYNTIDKEGYSDSFESFEDYLGFSKSWFLEARRISKQLIFTPGQKVKTLHMWFDIEEPLHYLIWYKPNGNGCDSLFRFNRQEPLLIYGEYRHEFDFFSNIIICRLENGFLRKEENIHGSPKEPKLYEEIIKRLRPKSVLDPFIGSGTIAYVCEKLGINYVGYEINHKFIPDIEKNIKNGIRNYTPKKKQILLDL